MDARSLPDLNEPKLVRILDIMSHQMDDLSSFIPMDRRQAMALGRGGVLPDRAAGAALFADISGSTPLAEALTRELGFRRGAEELTEQLTLNI